MVFGYVIFVVGYTIFRVVYSLIEIFPISKVNNS